MAFWESGKRLGKTRDLGMGVGDVRSLKGSPCQGRVRVGWGVHVSLKERRYIARQGGLFVHF